MIENQSILHVYSSHRSLMQHLKSDVLLTPNMLMGAFFEQIVIIDGYRAMPRAMRLPLSVAIIKECVEDLGRVKFIFERSFLGFLESSQFLFDFFTELTQAQVAISEIPTVDIYEDYADHLRVLEKVEQRYKQRLEALRFYDGYILPENAKMRINEAFIKRFECIDIYLEGIMSKAHLYLLEQISTMTTLRLHFCVDMFNTHLSFLPTRLLKQCHISHRYAMRFDTAEIVESSPIIFSAKIRSYSFALRISQVSLVLYQIQEWLKSGIFANDIVVIVPDEHFARYLALFDKAGNLNFAMGKDITHTRVYKHLQSYLSSCEESQDDKPSPYAQICEDIQSCICRFEDSQSKKVRQKVSELLFIWGSIYERKCTHQEILALLCEELKKSNIDDVSGGKVRVIGVLESRGFKANKVIIVDFNDGIVPSVSSSDLFLNSQLRQRLGMPTIKEKELLQKHYYYSILSTAQEVVITYVANEETHKSLLLDELTHYQDIHIEENDGDKHFALLPQGRNIAYREDTFIGTLSKTLTPSKLQTFLECARKYYYQHIESLRYKDKSDAALMGNILHQCLHSVYEKYIAKKVQLKARDLCEDMKAFLNSYPAGNANQIAEIKLMYYELEAFLQKEDNHLVEILCLEQDMQGDYKGFNMHVRPDRVQKVNERIEIIDYKYKTDFKIKKRENMTDFALILYKHIFLQNYPQYAHLPIELCYFDIKGCKILPLNDVEEIERILCEKIASLHGKIHFEKCEKRNSCRYCDFKILCQR